MRDPFNIKSSNEIPSIQIFNDRGIKTMAYSDFDKIEALNTYFSSLSSIDDSMKHCQIYIICIMILYAILQLMNKEFIYDFSISCEQSYPNRLR